MILPSKSLSSSTAVKSDPVLACLNLHRYLGRNEGRVHAVRGVSFDLYSGRSYAITGPSGCGKSTLLYSLGLLDRPDEGGVFFRGRNLSLADDAVRSKARLEHVGFVFQFHFLLTELSAMENVMLPMLRHGRLSRKESRERAHDLLDRVGLAGKENRLANHLSIGEQQRVAVARSVANSPPVVLADEPTGNLDADNTQKVVDLLLELAARQGTTVVIVTHNDEIAKRCEARFFMKDGVISTK